MASTFTLTATGIPAEQEQQKASLLVEDAYAASGAQASAASTGAAVLCKRPDGSTGYFRIDAERSRPGAPVLLAL